MAQASPEVSRYAIYTRQSVADTSEFSSCEAQFDQCQRFARAEGGGQREWIGKRFDDRGHSGAGVDRPGLEQLRRLVARRLVKHVYITRLDRLSRSLRDTCALLDEFEEAGVQLHTAASPELATGADLRFIRHILASFAEFERDMTASRIADTRAKMKAQGKRLAGVIPFGYVADERTKQLKQDRREASQVRHIFRMAASGLRPSEIAAQINAMGWTTKVFVARRSERTRGGQPWSARQILEVLHNPVYLGCFRDGETTRPGRHKAIVPRQLFDAVQAQIGSRKVPRGQLRTSNDFPLRMKVLCPSCQRPLSSYSGMRLTKYFKVKYRYYRCRSTAGGRPPCRSIQFRAYDIESGVCNALASADTWLTVRPDLLEDAETLCTIWKALDEAQQRQLLPNIVSRVRIIPEEGQLLIDFEPELVDIISQAHAVVRDRRRKRAPKRELDNK